MWSQQGVSLRKGTWGHLCSSAVRLLRPILSCQSSPVDPLDSVSLFLPFIISILLLPLDLLLLFWAEHLSHFILHLFCF